MKGLAPNFQAGAPQVCSPSLTPLILSVAVLNLHNLCKSQDMKYMNLLSHSCNTTAQPRLGQ